jgi:hypothetical protein
MDEQYRLVFSGEVLDGQHPAVVKKRLAAVLKLDDERMDVLFSGKPVVVKKAIDEKNAARYQQAFNKAGARLRVLPAAESDDAPVKSTPADQSPHSSASPSVDQLAVLPPGADVLTDQERQPEAVADVDTSHLALQGAVFVTDEPEEVTAGPNVDHLSLAELGAQLGVPRDSVVTQEIDVDFDLAEVGAILGELEKNEPPVIDPASVDFELSEPGADIGTREAKPAPPPPDTSHLKLDD